MSKSLGNFYTVDDLLQKGRGETIKFAMLSCHYRQPLNWLDDTLTKAKAALDGLYTALKGFSADKDIIKPDPEFLAALQDDLNTPKAIARLHELAKKANKAKDQDKHEIQAVLKASAALMGLLQDEPTAWFQGGTQDKYVDSDNQNNKDNAPGSFLSNADIESLIQERQTARHQKDFQKSDAIRDQLLEQGILLEDSADGTTWKRV